MRVVATADLHGAFPEIPECDLLLIAGDVCPVMGSHEPGTQTGWMKKRFGPWLKDQPAKHIVWIGGNHDFVCQSRYFQYALPHFPENSHYIIDETIEIEGVRIYGSPWVPHLASWAFYRHEAKFIDQSEAMPPADIYLLHGPPKGILDAVSIYEHVGAPYIERSIVKHEIPQVVFGHVHEGYGTLERGPTTYRNVSYMDWDYVPTNAPQVFEV